MDIETLCQKIMSQASRNGFDAWDWYKKTGTTSLFEYGIRKGYLLSVLFNHQFAKAFWGVEWPKELDIRGNFPYYKMELTQLAMLETDEDKLRYMEKFLTL